MKNAFGSGETRKKKFGMVGSFPRHLDMTVIPVVDPGTVSRG
jgi:hypothetical protein